ncbi:MAG: hypothetical protein FVQ82_09775 [Planctomycetes bacterium]|nr:hypothetical protein [Planctomycetota bacterium]
MNIEKGGKRLVMTISWLIAIRIYIGWPTFADNPRPLWYFLGLGVSLLAVIVCIAIGNWVLDGFIDNQENKN